MTDAADPAWRRGMVSHLSGLYDAARLDLRIRHIPKDPTPLQILELRRPGGELYNALFDPTRRVEWRCSVTRRPGLQVRVHSPKLFEVNDRRLVLIPIQRPPRFPSGWRPEEWLIVDLRLLTAEKHPGFYVTCPLCGRIHRFDTQQLRKEIDDTYSDTGEPAGSPPPDDYPPLEQAAFVELRGPYDELETELTKSTPELYVRLTPHRAELLEAELAKHPGAPTYPQLLAGPALRHIYPSGEVRLEPAISPYDENQRIWERDPQAEGS